MLLLVLFARDVRATGCTTLLLRDDEGSTNERAKPAMQAMETVEKAASFISVAVGVGEEFSGSISVQRPAPNHADPGAPCTQKRD